MPNINDKIKVKLTSHGQTVYRKHLQDDEALLPVWSRGRSARYWILSQSLEGKAVEFPLWEFASIFGKHMYVGAENVIVDNSFELMESLKCL